MGPVHSGYSIKLSSKLFTKLKKLKAEHKFKNCLGDEQESMLSKTSEWPQKSMNTDVGMDKSAWKFNADTISVKNKPVWRGGGGRAVRGHGSKASQHDSCMAAGKRPYNFLIGLKLPET